ncbi:MAG: dTMP kinase [Candidatus Korarchaeota archaeon]
MNRGPFISVDGCDGSGNTTLSAFVADILKEYGYDVVLTAEPTEGKIGKLIRTRLREGEKDAVVDALLFAADRIDHCRTLIEPALNEGKAVVSDRYFESSMAYQTTYGVPDEFVEKINSQALKTDLTIILIVNPEISLKRKPQLTDWVENVDFLTKVVEKFKKRAEIMKYPTVRTDIPIEETKSRVRQIIDEFIKRWKK